MVNFLILRCLHESKANFFGHYRSQCAILHCMVIKKTSRDIIYIVTVDKQETEKHLVIMKKECFICIDIHQGSGNWCPLTDYSIA